MIQVVIYAAFGLGLYVCDAQQRSRDIAEQQARWNSYPAETRSAIENLNWRSFENDLSESAPVGKVLALFINNDDLDIHKELMAALGSESSIFMDSIGTIAIYELGDPIVVGQYSSGGGEARVRTAKVSFINASSGTIYHIAHFEGSQPPDKIRRRGSDDSGAWGSLPLPSTIATYIDSLIYR